jgi:hypothetical protein
MLVLAQDVYLPRNTKAEEIKNCHHRDHDDKPATASQQHHSGYELDV